MSVSYGGQAVLEGVMMRGPSCWAVAVRTPEGGIEEVVRDVTSPMKRHRLWRLPVIRGVIALGESLAIGFRALAISANYAVQKEPEEGEEATEEVSTEISRGQIIFSFVIAIGFALMLFKVGPALLTNWLPIDGTYRFVLVEGVIRVSIFIEADPAQIEAAASLGALAVELHTGTYAEGPIENRAVSAMAITAITPACTGSVTTRSLASGTLPAMFRLITVSP